MKITNEPYMDLHIDYLGVMCGKDAYAVSHNYIQNGDLMKDPDMMFFDIGDRFLAASFEQDGGLPVSQFSIECIDGKFLKNPRLQISHQSFSNEWASNLKKQGFTKKKNIKVSYE